MNIIFLVDYIYLDNIDNQTEQKMMMHAVRNMRRMFSTTGDKSEGKVFF